MAQVIDATGKDIAKSEKGKVTPTTVTADGLWSTVAQTQGKAPSIFKPDPTMTSTPKAEQPVSSDIGGDLFQPVVYQTKQTQATSTPAVSPKAITADGPALVPNDSATTAGGTLNKTTLDNMKTISDMAIADANKGHQDQNIESTMRKLVESGKISTDGQGVDKTVKEAVAYYKFVQGDDSQIGDVSQGGPLAENIKVLTSVAAKDRGVDLTDDEIESKVRDLVKDGTIKIDGQSEDKTISDAVNYYKYVRGANNNSTPNKDKTYDGTPTSIPNSTPGTPGYTPQNTPGQTMPTTSTQNILMMNEEEINNLINRIRKVIEELDSYWSYIKNNCMEKVKNSWVADETKTYVDSVLAEDNNVNKIKESLLLLANTYESVRNNVNNTQSENAKYIQNNF